MLKELIFTALMLQPDRVTSFIVPNNCLRPFASHALQSSHDVSRRRRQRKIYTNLSHQPMLHDNGNRGIEISRNYACLFASSSQINDEDDGRISYDEGESSNAKLPSSSRLEHREQWEREHTSSMETASSSSSIPDDSLIEISSFSEDLGEFNPDKKMPMKRKAIVGDPQLKVLKEKYSVTAILKELAAIQQQGPQKYCILGTRHCSFLHQQIIELLSYALVLSENHVYTSGAMGTNAAAIRGALRAGRDDLLTVILPQSLSRQPNESQDLLREVTDLVTMPQNDDMDLDVASRLCNSKLLSETDQLVAFAFHESTTVIEAVDEAKKLDMLVTTLFLD